MKGVRVSVHASRSISGLVLTVELGCGKLLVATLMLILASNELVPQILHVTTATRLKRIDEIGVKSCKSISCFYRVTETHDFIVTVLLRF